ncbi:MAG: DsbA family protein [Gammaproteobacteria bacterium]|nr:MAG: DsbA family protein [Gammaproteobacteria bacterium]
MNARNSIHLYYVLDPMCSWCWGFRPVFQRLLETLPIRTTVQYVMGGLAPDSDQPMTEATRQYVQKMWRAVEKHTGAKFNYDFWKYCHPRRSTYPACRAIIASGLQKHSAIPDMIFAIQKAYYLQSLNPSNLDILIRLSEEIGLDGQRFENDITSKDVETLLQQDFQLRRDLGVMSFPSVIMESNNNTQWLANGYLPIEDIIKKIPNDILKAYQD